MDEGWLIVVGVLAFVILLNAGIILSAIRYREANPRPLFGEGVGDFLNPWRKENQDLEELHDKVDALKSKTDDRPME